MSATDLTRRDTRDTITLEIVDIDGSEEKILRVDIEGLTSESESNEGWKTIEYPFEVFGRSRVVIRHMVLEMPYDNLREVCTISDK